MARKGWNSLSPGYRARLEKNGISESAYNSGESIQKARGHSQTPERPSQAANFPTYQRERTQLTARIASKKYYYFGTTPKWNPLKAAKKFREEPPPMIRIRQWASMNMEEMLEAIREDPAAAAYLGYH